MARFVITKDPIEASRQRVVSVWFGDVDRVALHSDPALTGSAVLAAVFTVTATYRYYVVFLSLGQRVVEVWHTDPVEVPMADAEIVQRDILRHLKEKGIVLRHLPADNRHYHRILSLLPYAYDNSADMPSTLGIPDESANSDTLTDEEKDTLRSIFVHF